MWLKFALNLDGNAICKATSIPDWQVGIPWLCVLPVYPHMVKLPLSCLSVFTPLNYRLTVQLLSELGLSYIVIFRISKNTINAMWEVIRKKGKKGMYFLPVCPRFSTLQYMNEQRRMFQGYGSVDRTFRAFRNVLELKNCHSRYNFVSNIKCDKEKPNFNVELNLSELLNVVQKGPWVKTWHSRYNFASNIKCYKENPTSMLILEMVVWQDNLKKGPLTRTF